MSDDEGQSLLDLRFEGSLSSTSTYLVEPLSVKTRSTTSLPNPETKLYSSYEGKRDFPKVKVRTSQKNTNEQIIRCTVQCLADYKVSPSDLSGIIVHTDNIIFGQQWELPEEPTDEGESENEDEDTLDCEVGLRQDTSKGRKCIRDLTYVFPSRRVINRYIEDVSYINLLIVAKQLINIPLQWLYVMDGTIQYRALSPQSCQIYLQ